MRISFILDTFGGGGKERRCLQLIQGLNRDGYKDIQVIIVNDTVRYPALYEAEANICILDRKNRNLNLIQTIKELKKQFKDFNPEIVQSWGGISTFLSICLKPAFKYKLIGSFVADVFGAKAFSLKAFYPFFCDKVVGNSRAGLLAYKIPREKAVLIYNGFNENRFDKQVDKQEKKDEIGIQTPFVVAMVATFWKTKDWRCYLLSAKQIVAKRKDITFLAIGDGPDWEKCNSLIREEEKRFIMLLGHRSDTDEILQICDITILVSNLGEGVSNSIVESMAFGVPVIATNSGGTPEIIEDGINGVLLLNNNVSELVGKIEFLIGNTKKREEMGECASKTIKESFSLNAMTQQYVNLYKSLL